MSKTFAIALPADRFAAVFGTPTEERTPGRSRRCRVCGDWHSLKQPWPHNCRSEAPPRSPLASPQIAPKFEAFRPNVHADTVINDHRDKRDYMERHDLAEYDAGVAPEPEPTDRAYKREFVEDFKRAMETDPLSQPPVDIIGQTDTEDAGDICVDNIEVAI